MARDDFNKEKDFETTERSEADLSEDLSKQLKEVAGTAKKLFDFQKEKICSAIPKGTITEKASAIADKIHKDEILDKAKSAYGNVKERISSAFSNGQASADDKLGIQADLEYILEAAKFADPNNEYSKVLVTYALVTDGSIARVANIVLANDYNSNSKVVTIGDSIAYFEKEDSQLFFCCLVGCNIAQVNYEPSFEEIFENDKFVPNRITLSVKF